MRRFSKLHCAAGRSFAPGLLLIPMGLMMAFAAPVFGEGADAINRVLESGDRAPPDGRTPPAQPDLNGSGANSATKERWIEGGSPIENFQLIAAQPAPGKSCREVIFSSVAHTSHRYEPRHGETLRLDLNEVCLLGLRNSSDRRSVLVRIGEAFEALAIGPSPHLFTGQVLRPNEQIRIPVRLTNIGQLPVRVEIMWDDQRESPARQIDVMTVEFLGKRP